MGSAMLARDTGDFGSMQERAGGGVASRGRVLVTGVGALAGEGDNVDCGALST